MRRDKIFCRYFYETHYRNFITKKLTFYFWTVSILIIVVSIRITIFLREQKTYILNRIMNFTGIYKGSVDVTPIVIYHTNN